MKCLYTMHGRAADRWLYQNAATTETASTTAAQREVTGQRSEEEINDMLDWAKKSPEAGKLQKEAQKKRNAVQVSSWSEGMKKLFTYFSTSDATLNRKGMGLTNSAAAENYAAEQTRKTFDDWKEEAMANREADITPEEGISSLISAIGLRENGKTTRQDIYTALSSALLFFTTEDIRTGIGHQLYDFIPLQKAVVKAGGSEGMVTDMKNAETDKEFKAVLSILSNEDVPYVFTKSDIDQQALKNQYDKEHGSKMVS